MAVKSFKLTVDDLSQALGQYLVDSGKLSEGVEGGTINFYKNIEQRANELAATKINNSQQGFIANDNINNDNQE